MTTIAFVNGIMAADSRAYGGHSTPIGFKCKLYTNPRTGAWIGVSTNVPGLSEQVGQWFADDKNPSWEPQLSPNDGLDALEVHRDGSVYIYHCSMKPAGPLTAPFFAVGSGADYALGALFMGASAAEAIQVAAQCDPWTGGEIHTAVVNEETNDGS